MSRNQMNCIEEYVKVLKESRKLRLLKWNRVLQVFFITFPVNYTLLCENILHPNLILKFDVSLAICIRKGAAGIPSL